MALIKTLREFLTKNVIYPTTKTNAVYDDTVGRLDTFLHNTLGAEPIDNVEEELPELRDADTLGGRYTAEDLDAMPKSTAIEDYANVEPPVNDADSLGGKYTAKNIEQEFAKINSSLEDIFKPKKLFESPNTIITNANTETTIYSHTFTKETLVNANIRILVYELDDSKLCDCLIYHNTNRLIETEYTTSGSNRNIVSFSILEKFNVGDTLTVKCYTDVKASAKVIIWANYID